MFYRVSKCRACQGTGLVKVFDLGSQVLANDFQFPGAECAGMAPLEVLFCKTCTLGQLSVVVRPEIMYRQYSYVTSDSTTMQDHFRKLFLDLVAETPRPNRPQKLLEIGSNNGALIEYARTRGYEVLGMEPAKNLADIANGKQLKTMDRFFDTSSAVELGATGYKADVIIARHVFAHVDDWQGFIHALNFVSHEKTLVVIEVPYVGDMLDLFSWDQVYSEHLSYVSVTAIHKLLEGTKFYLSDVKHYDIHGGAIALMMRRTDDGRPSKMNPEWHSRFEEKDLESRWRNLDALKRKGLNDLVHLIASLKSKGKKICGFGASAKATVWMNAIQATRKQIDFVCDSTEQKQGRLVPGTDIPVVPESRLMEADYAVVFCWNFLTEVLEKNKSFKGKWIVPVPEVKIL
jgi:C-methyltransferase-like protein/methyltransferase family protein/putative zinc binding protein